MMYLEMYKEYLSHLRKHGLTEESAIKRGLLFLHTHFLWERLTLEAQTLVAKHKINIENLYGYIVPHHTALGRPVGVYRVYFLGEMKKHTLHDPLDITTLNYITDYKWVSRRMKLDAEESRKPKNKRGG